MNKREFLSKLEEALVYELPPRAVDENLRYYSSYIDSEVKSGRSVEEVLGELGDPRLIARTIIDAVSSGADGIPGTADDVVYRETPDSDDSGYGAYGGRASDHGSSDNGGFRGSVEINSHTYSGCMPCLIAVLIACLIISALMGLLSMLAPVLAPVAVILLIWWLLGKAGDDR